MEKVYGIVLICNCCGTFRGLLNTRRESTVGYASLISRLSSATSKYPICQCSGDGAEMRDGKRRRLMLSSPLCAISHLTEVKLEFIWSANVNLFLCLSGQSVVVLKIEFQDPVSDHLQFIFIYLLMRYASFLLFIGY